MRGKTRTMKSSLVVVTPYLILLSPFGRHHAHGHHIGARAFVVTDSQASKGQDGGITRLFKRAWTLLFWVGHVVPLKRAIGSRISPGRGGVRAEPILQSCWIRCSHTSASPPVLIGFID